MGYTSFTKSLVSNYLHGVKSVIDLGAQNDFTYPLPAPYISEWYEGKGILYKCIDLNGENRSMKIDLSKIIYDGDSFVTGKLPHRYDLVLDIGTSEHVGPGKRDEFAYYNCWLNKHNLCREGGLIISENPKTGNWPGHGFNYITVKFIEQLKCYDVLAVGEHSAMGNTKDGWNIFSVLLKTKRPFPSFEEFTKYDIYGT